MIRSASARTWSAIVAVALPLAAAGCELRERPSSRTDAVATLTVTRSGGAVLPVEQGRAVLDQCTRRVPWGVRGFWTPSRSVIDTLEARLGEVLSNALEYPSSAVDTARAGEDEFLRQYVGLVRWSGARTVYVNGIHASTRKTRYGRRPDGRAISDTFPWRAVPVSVCDGGSHYFGVEYDPATRTFGAFRFNARAG